MGRSGSWAVLTAVLVFPSLSEAHDIPNARVDRSTQVTLRPGRIDIDYEVSLSELTLTQELRTLIGSLPGSDRAGWFQEYGRETGPMNARGFLVEVDGTPIKLSADGFDLDVEQHPRFTFHFSGPLSPAGRLRLRDTNFQSSEGTSRLAVRGEGLDLHGDDTPPDVSAIPARPVWQLTDAEETRSRSVLVDFKATGRISGRVVVSSRLTPHESPSPASGGLSALLDRSSGLSLAILGLLALGLGTVHAVQPGHGKTLVAAASVGGRGSWTRGVLLALLTTLVHTGSIFLVAAALWWTVSERFGSIHSGLTRASGFLVASTGFWRLGRHIAGLPEHGADATSGPADARGLFALALAGGMVPCWDAVGLVAVSAAVGRLGLGLFLVVAFGLGMALVLSAVGFVSGRLRRSLVVGKAKSVWERRLGLASGGALAMMGVYLLAARP